MSQTLSRCVNVQLSVNLPEFKCTDDILGNFGNLTDFGRGLGSIPSQLGSIVDCVADDLRQQIEQAIKPYLETIRAIMKALNLRIPDPIFGTIEIPEFEFELRLTALWTDFKFYLYEKLIDILSNIPGLSFILNLLKVPIPFLEGVYLIDVFTEEGRARIAKAVRDRLDQVAEALGMPWDFSFTGKLTLESPDFAFQNILRRVYSMVSKMISNIIYNALTIIPKILFDIGGRLVRQLWEALKLPFLPLLALIEQAFDFKKLFTSIWESVVEEFDNAVDRMKAMIERILEINVLKILENLLKPLGVIWDGIKRLWTFGETIRDMLKISDEEWNLTLPEIKFARIMQAVQDLFDRIATMIFELWLQLIKNFLERILSLVPQFIKDLILLLLKYIPFTFCSFINLFASAVLGIGGLVRDLLPPGIEIVIVNPLPALPAT